MKSQADTTSPLFLEVGRQHRQKYKHEQITDDLTLKNGETDGVNIKEVNKLLKNMCHRKQDIKQDNT